MFIEMEISRVLINEATGEQAVCLAEVGGERRLTIMIGIVEAVAIDRRLKGMVMPRPLTHDLLANVLAKLGAAHERTEIYDLSHNTYFARLVLRQGDSDVVVECRPSDAFALGATTGRPILVAEHVIVLAQS